MAARADDSGRMNVEFQIATSAEQAVQEADVIVTATTSSVPVFQGSQVTAGTHVNAIGAFTPETRELDSSLIQAAKLVVDTRAGCLEEAGDLLIPLGEQRITEADFDCELGELAAGSRPGRSDAAQITVFKSVGSAAFDVVAALEVCRSAERLGLGQPLELP